MSNPQIEHTSLHRNAERPPVTEAHRQAAFAAMQWVGWTYASAMADNLRVQVIEVRAAHLRNRDFAAAMYAQQQYAASHSVPGPDVDAAEPTS